MSTYLTTGIILRKDYVRDYDREYVIFTREAGKIKALAKSANKITSKLCSHLEPFLVVNLMIANGKKFKRIAAAQIKKNYYAIAGDLTKIVIADYFLEVFDALIRFEYCDRAVFKILDNFLSQLAISESREFSLLVLNKNLFDLLSQLGYCPVIKVRNQRQLSNNLHQLVLEVGEREVKSFRLLMKLF